MTPTRGTRRRSRRWTHAAAGAALAALAAVLAVAPVLSRSAYPPLVVDPATGLAIFGYDPVAYFVDGEARPGDPKHEAVWQGATWRFVNTGNRAAFLDHPEVYSPAYGGYGALSVARGLTTAGKPVHFALHEGTLYFFYSTVNRHIWLDSPGAFVEQASRNWRTLAQRLVR
jgi:YHS domain-containing protein